MRHKLSGRKLNRTSAHRKALLRNMACSLVKFEQIKTTLPKAKELRPYIEKLVTKARLGTLAARRDILSSIQDRELVSKMMDTLADRYRKRPGGYVRIIRSGFRYGDNAPMAYIEFVERDLSAKPAMPREATEDLNDSSAASASA
ncbi:MAG: 50S ribosomal protein L17 [Alphaproteobacteria bacterium]|nr:MAG: 50S ribosomal protein L17 [Alphaproteobacteria bacterium]